MNVYLITYDLNKDSLTHKRIKDAISLTFENKEILKNIFVVKSNLSALEIHDLLSLHISIGEKLLILKIETGTFHDGSWNDLSSDFEAWLIKALL